MRICILMQEVQTLGGVQRVVTTIFNRLAEDERYKIFILAPENNTGNQLYPINKKINLINDKVIKTNISFSKLLIKLNKKTGLMKGGIFNDFLEDFYFPMHIIDKYLEIIKQNRIDCIIGMGAYHTILAARIRKFVDLKCIGWMHSTFDGYFNTPGNDTFALLNLFNKYSSYIDKLLVLTQADKVDFYNNCRELLSEPIVLHNPLTLNIKEHSRCDFNSLLYMGRITFNPKGTDRLIPIMKKVIKYYPNIKLYVVGSGPDLKKMKNHITKEHLEKNIILCGVSDCVQEYYKNCSLLLLPSRYEGFGLVITEAFAYGLPVIAFHSNGPDEIIDDSVNGYLLNQGDVEGFANAVIKLLSNKTRYLSFSNAAVKRAKDFSIDNILSQLNCILEN